MKQKLIIASGILVLGSSTINAQCDIVGLNPTYCEADAPSTLSAPGAGTFSGPGITGDVFDPVKIRDVTVLKTVVDGKVVFEK